MSCTPSLHHFNSTRPCISWRLHVYSCKISMQIDRTICMGLYQCPTSCTSPVITLLLISFFHLSLFTSNLISPSPTRTQGLYHKLPGPYTILTRGLSWAVLYYVVLCGKMFWWVGYELRLIWLIVIRPNIQSPSTAHQALRDRPHSIEV